MNTKTNKICKKRDRGRKAMKDQKKRLEVGQGKTAEAMYV
jgi:hypothetical protein